MDVVVELCACMYNQEVLKAQLYMIGPDYIMVLMMITLGVITILKVILMTTTYEDK